MKIVPLWKHPHYTISDTGIITNVLTNKVSISVIHRIARREGRYANVI